MVLHIGIQSKRKKNKMKRWFHYYQGKRADDYGSDIPVSIL